MPDSTAPVRPATTSDVARLAGVDRACVSVVLNGAKSNVGVSAEARDRILAAARTLNYRPSAAAQSLVSGRTRQLFVLSSESGRRRLEEGYPNLRGLIDVAGERDYRVVVSWLAGGDQGARQLENLIRDRVCDGLCLFGDQLPESQIRVLERHRLPCVVVGDEPLSASGLEQAFTVRVDFDNFHYAYGAVAWLVSQGHRRVAYIRHEYEGDQPHNVALRAGYAQALRDLAPETVPHIEFGAHDQVDITGFLKRKEYSAVVLGSPRLALKWARLAREAGLDLPSEILILAFSERNEILTPFSDEWQDTLAFALHDWNDCGRLAGEVLLSWIASGAVEAGPHLVDTFRTGWCGELVRYYSELYWERLRATGQLPRSQAHG